MPSEWDFGSRPDSALIERSFSFKNTAKAEVHVSAMVSCECLAITPSAFTLAPGRSIRISVSYNPKGSRGAVANAIIFKATGGESADRVFAVKGTIVARGPVPSEEGCVPCRTLEENRRKAAGASPDRSR